MSDENKIFLLKKIERWKNKDVQFFIENFSEEISEKNYEEKIRLNRENRENIKAIIHFLAGNDDEFAHKINTMKNFKAIVADIELGKVLISDSALIIFFTYLTLNNIIKALYPDIENINKKTGDKKIKRGYDSLTVIADIAKNIIKRPND